MLPDAPLSTTVGAQKLRQGWAAGIILAVLNRRL